jgi:hypothetical protein
VAASQLTETLEAVNTLPFRQLTETLQAVNSLSFRQLTPALQAVNTLPFRQLTETLGTYDTLKFYGPTMQQLARGTGVFALYREVLDSLSTVALAVLR